MKGNNHKPRRLPSGGILYRGKEFRGVNVPRASTRRNKKAMVLTQKGTETKVVHYGSKPSNSGKEGIHAINGRKGYLKKAHVIRNPDGKLCKRDKFSPHYWNTSE